MCKFVIRFFQVNLLVFVTPEKYEPRCQKTCFLHMRKQRRRSLSVPRSKTALYDGSFSATAPKLWNALPSDIRTCSSLDNFKKSAKITL